MNSVFFERQRTTDNRNPPFVLRLLTGEAKDRCPLFHNSVFPAKPKPRELRPKSMALTTRNHGSFDPKAWHLRPVTMGVLTQKYGTFILYGGGVNWLFEAVPAVAVAMAVAKVGCRL